MTKRPTAPSADAVPIHIDTDPGADDLLALCVLMASPEVRVVGITTVAGNAPLEAVTENACRFVALAGARIPVGRGAAAPLRARPVTAMHVHGDDGRHGVPLPPPIAESPGGAEEIFRRSLAEEGARTLLALGPLTNVAHLLQATPDLLEGTEIVWMGGSLVGGNVTPVAEFNCYADPDAAELVLGSGLPVRIVGLDVTRRVRLRPPDLPAELLGPGPRGRMLSQLLERLMNAEAAARGERCATLHDPCAAVALAVPRYFRFEERHLGVGIEGSDRGRLVARDGAGGAPVQYAMEIEAKKVMALCLERLRCWSLEETEGAEEDGCGRSH